MNVNTFSQGAKMPMGNSFKRKHFHQNIYVFLSLSLNRYNVLVDTRIEP